MLEFMEFNNEVKNILEERLGEKVEISDTTRNNHIIKIGLIFPENKVSPFIYMDDYYKDYRKKKYSIEEIAEHIIEIKKENDISNFDIDFVMNFDKVKDKIILQVINKTMNMSLLETTPYIDIVGDICFIFKIKVDLDGSENRNTTIRVSNQFLNEWGITKEELYRIAEKNTIKNHPTEMDQLSKLFPEEVEVPPNSFVVFRNDLGAAPAFIPSEIKKYAELVDGDVYIIPSSTEEALLIEKDNNTDKAFVEQMTELLKYMNFGELSPEIVLSNHMYCYHKEENRYSVLS